MNSNNNRQSKTTSIQTKNTGNGKMNATNEQQNLLRKGRN